jgi:hypothetical protein
MIVLLLSNPSIAIIISSFICHCEHPRGVWQSYIKIQDFLISITMTLLIIGFRLFFAVYSLLSAVY